MGVAAIPAPAQPCGWDPDGAVRAAAAPQQPELHRWRMTRHGFGRLKGFVAWRS